MDSTSSASVTCAFNIQSVNNNASTSASAVTQPAEDYLAPVKPETVSKGPSHQALLDFINTMSSDRPAVTQLIADAHKEALHSAPGERELVAKDILLVRHAVKEKNMSATEKYQAQKEATKAATDILETPKSGLKGRFHQWTSSITQSSGASRSDLMKNNLHKALFAMIDTSADWVTPNRQKGDARHELEKPRERLNKDIQRIARTATRILDNQQQSEVFARMVSIAHKTCTHGPIMYAAEQWLSKNMTGSKSVLLACVKQVMCGNTALERNAYKLLKHHMGKLGRKDLIALHDEFEAATTGKAWEPAKADLVFGDASVLAEAEAKAHTSIIHKLEQQFNLHLPSSVGAAP